MSEFFNQFLHQFKLPLSNPVLVFSLLLFIILVAPIIFKRFKIPGIIGLILSGVVVGPFALNLLENNSAIDLFSTIGLLYIMFIAGLDLDMNEFKRTRNKSFLFGFFTFILPLSIGFPFCYFILGYGFNASMLIASMFSTHTLVSYPIVSKLGISKNQAVAVAVGGTILTDTAVLIILAVVIGNSEGSLNQAFWIRLVASLAVFSAIMFLLIPKITKWFFSKLESEKHAHYIFVLAVVFFAAFLAEISGVQPIIGAFVAGLALNPLIPKSSALMNRIEFIGNSLFIPFFLISVGMLVDLRVIFNGPMAIIIAVSLTIVAIIGKWLAAYFTQITFKYSKAQRKLIFGLSSSHAAATLAVILVGYKAGILDENILNGTIILILVTCIVASFATEKASKQILLSEESNDLSNKEVHFFNTENILLPIANLMNIEKLLEFTLLIKEKKSPNPLTILSVVPNNAEAELNIVSARNKLEKFKIQGAASEVLIKTIATIDYNVASGINRVSREIMADIIVLGWPKKAGILDKVIGEKINSIIENNDKNLFICGFESLLINQKRIIVITSPLAEKEDGFMTWLQKISKLSHELSVPVVHFGSASTQEAMRTVIKQKKLSLSINFSSFNDWEDLNPVTSEISDTDLIILISARRNSVSYNHYFDRLSSKIEKQFVHNNKILIFPRQFSSSSYL